MTRFEGADAKLTQVCVAAVPTALLTNDCLALAWQCVGSTGLGLAHRIVGIVALSLYLLPHMNYVRMGQRDLRQMPYSAYRWVARMHQVLFTGAVLRLRAMWDRLAGGCSQHLAAAQRHFCCCCSCKRSCPFPAGPALQHVAHCALGAAALPDQAVNRPHTTLAQAAQVATAPELPCFMQI